MTQFEVVNPSYPISKEEAEELMRFVEREYIRPDEYPILRVMLINIENWLESLVNKENDGTRSSIEP